MPTASDYLQSEPTPDSNAINTGIEPLHQRTVLAYFGDPAPKTASILSGGEADVDQMNPKLRAKIHTVNVGPFAVTGHVQACAALAIILGLIKTSDPLLYLMLGNDGMLCCRLVRGSQTNWSNHAFGFAIDITLKGHLDRRGDGYTQAGLLKLDYYFKQHGWYWGAEFSTEDSMHFEVGNAKFLEWQSQGYL